MLPYHHPPRNDTQMTLPSAGCQCVIALMVACGHSLLCVFTL